MSHPSPHLNCKGWIVLLVLLFLAGGHLPAHPQSSGSLSDAVLFQEGEGFLVKGDVEKALWRFKRLLTVFPNSSLATEAKFKIGVCYTELKRPKDAVQVLNELFSGYLTPFRMVQVFVLLGDNHLALKDPLAALQWYGKGLLIAGGPYDDLKKKVRSIIDTLGTLEKLSQIETLYRGAYAGGYAKVKLAQLARQQGNEVLSKKILSEWEKEYRSTDYGALLRELSEPPQPQVKARYVVGVILPLSGMYKLYAEKTLQGIELAVKEMEGPGKTPILTLAIRDSKGEPDIAEKAVGELVTQERVIAIIGPLLSSTVERAARKAQQLKVPLFTLSQKEILLGKNDYLFQSSVTASSQLDALMAFAVRDLELRTFATFFPNSPYGLHFKNLFSNEVIRRGGRLIGALTYQEDQSDFSQEIKTFFKIKTVPKPASSRKKDEDYIPNLSLDGLFIPDTYDRAGLILTQLDYFNIRGVVFLGSNGWNNPGLLTTAGSSAEGAFFVDAFSKENPTSSVRQFFTEFQKTYSRDPETLEALGYETADFLGGILRSRSVNSPQQMKDEINRVTNFQGVSGLKGFGEGGKPRRVFSILRVKNGRIEHYSP